MKGRELRVALAAGPLRFAAGRIEAAFADLERVGQHAHRIVGVELFHHREALWGICPRLPALPCGQRLRPLAISLRSAPIHNEAWDVSRPGWLEADTVAHCGSSLAGDFIWSVTYPDIFSQWTESRAVWNKGAAGVVTRTREVEAALPFLLLGFESDNGGEFLNYPLWRYFSERAVPVSFTRSRPYHKNDNAHVEQKNWAHARQLLGYERLEVEALLEPINALYTEVWNPLQNFFYPSLALIEKVKEGSRYRKRYAPAPAPEPR